MSELRPGAPVAVGYEAVPEAGEGPGVLVLHAWWGLSDYFRRLCDRLAAAGFVAVAPDLWGGTVATTVEEAEGLIQQPDNAAMMQAVAGALAHLRSHPAVRGEGLGAVGFSMGAAWAVGAAGAYPALTAVTLFYGIGEGDFGVMRAAFLGHFAEGDPWEPEEGVRWLEGELRGAGREVQFHTYPGVGHWFFEENRPDAYNQAAAQLAWERTLAFLRERLG
jgi:carboxymethylenebutenolidase